MPGRTRGGLGYTVRPAPRSRPETITLIHPGVPGERVQVRPGLLRRLGLRTSPVATLAETCGTSDRAA